MKIDLEDPRREPTEKDLCIFKKIPLDIEKKILGVGAGGGRIEYNLAIKGFSCLCTDFEKYPQWELAKNTKGLDFKACDIFNIDTFPEKDYSIVICSQVLEHMKDYKLALKNLLNLTKNILVITIPWKKSFFHPEHCNFWDDSASDVFTDINEFRKLSGYETQIEKIYTKPADRNTNQMNYLITIDKRK